MKYFHIGMQNIPRTVNFIPQINSFGYLINATNLSGETTYVDKIEFCLRLKSPASHGREFFGGKEYQCPFPHLLIKTPGRTRKVVSEKDREAFYLIYTVKELEGFFKKISWDPSLSEEALAQKCFRPVEISPGIKNLMEELAFLADHSRESGNADRIDLLSFALLQEFFLDEQKFVQEKDFYETKIRRIASFIQLHFSQKLSIKLLAGEHAISLRSLFRYWRDIYGDSPHEHLQNLRLTESCRLLETTAQPISVIAERSGFTDASYFIRFFKQQYGMTPASYRKYKKKLPHEAHCLALKKK